MKSVQVGDLAKLFRRKRPGMGLVMKHVPDIVKEMKKPEVLNSLHQSREGEHTWHQRNEACSHFLDQCGLPLILAEAFLQHNAFQSYRPPWKTSDKTTTDFVYIRWFQRPSEYEQTSIRKADGWYPTEWLRKVQ